MSVTLEPRGSVFVVFLPANASTPGLGSTGSFYPDLEKIVEIPGPWEVRFQPGRGAPESVVLEHLADLSGHPDSGVRYFSGTATYRSSFRLSSVLPEKAPALVIDLGRVEVAARVRLNGRDMGIAWRAPYRLGLGNAWRPGSNMIEIEVVNLWQNRLIGDRSLPPEKRIAWTTRNPFREDSPLPPSGLIGPVTIGSAR